jgi:hypothetical protein
MKKLVLLMWAAALAGPLHAAEAGISIGESLYYVSTGTDGGTCKTRDLARGAHETVCTDGNNVAALSSTDGCLDSSGKGWCALDHRQPAGQAGSELTCAKGESWFLSVGAEATCKFDKAERKTCTSPDGKSSASASCASGCMETKGAGTCCEAGTANCPPSR